MALRRVLTLGQTARQDLAAEVIAEAGLISQSLGRRCCEHLDLLFLE
jgi:hypothetical protein